jgi:hypothetical protein
MLKKYKMALCKICSKSSKNMYNSWFSCKFDLVIICQNKYYLNINITTGEAPCQIREYWIQLLKEHLSPVLHEHKLFNYLPTDITIISLSRYINTPKINRVFQPFHEKILTHSNRLLHETFSAVYLESYSYSY